MNNFPACTFAVATTSSSSSFFGQETRYGHRVYGGVLINVGR
jgi:hypothetical protein